MQKLKRRNNLDRVEKNSNYKIWSVLKIKFYIFKIKKKKKIYIFGHILFFIGNNIYQDIMSKKRILYM